MKKVIVAGSGIAGSVLTRILRERGHRVTLVDGDPGASASRCAFAYLRTVWWTGEEKARVRAGLEWYTRHGWHLTDEALVVDLGRNRTAMQGDHHLIDPEGPLVTPDLHQHLGEYRDGPGGVLASAGEHALDAHHLVLACGSGMNRFSFGTPSFGGVLDARGLRMTKGAPLALLRVTDRLTHVAAGSSRMTRVGASRGPMPGVARDRAHQILNRMVHEGLVDGRAPWEYRPGVRWTSVNGSPGGTQVSAHVWTFTGFARSGYATVPSAALDLADRLENV